MKKTFSFLMTLVLIGFTTIANAGTAYTMICDPADLVDGGKYVIGSPVGDGYTFMANISGKFFVPSDTIAVTDMVATIDVAQAAPETASALWTNAPHEITLVKGESGWALYDALEEKYIYTSAAKSASLSNDPCYWTISFGDAYDAAITAGSFGSIQYNSSSPRFLNYTSSQSKVYLFKAGEVKVKPGVFVAPTFENVADVLAYGKNTEINVAMNNWTIASTGKNSIYVTDGTNQFQIFDYNIPEAAVEGATISGTINGVWTAYGEAWELCQITNWSAITFKAAIKPCNLSDGDDSMVYRIKYATDDLYVTAQTGTNNTVEVLDATSEAQCFQFIATANADEYQIKSLPDHRQQLERDSYDDSRRQLRLPGRRGELPLHLQDLQRSRCP